MGVVFGGVSVEHDVSIVTAHQAMAALSERHEVVPIYITREGRWLTSPALDDLAVYRDGRWDEVGKPCYIPPVPGSGLVLADGGRGLLARKGGTSQHLDVVLPAVHGTYGEDGTLQGLLEMADIPYAGPNVAGSALGMDKPAMKAVFAAAGLPVLPHVLIEGSELDRDADAAIALVEGSIGYPAFAKPARLGSSVGIGKAKDRATLEEVLAVARSYDRRVMVERSAEGCIEVNCSVLGGYGHEPRASVCEQPLAWKEFLSFADKYMGSGKTASSKDPQGMSSLDRRIPAPISDALTKQVQENALRAFRAIDAAGVARVDSFVNQETGEAWVNEINTVPGSFAFYLWEASGLSFADLLGELIDIALAGHRSKKDLLFTFESGILERAGGGKRG